MRNRWDGRPPKGHGVRFRGVPRRLVADQPSDGARRAERQRLRLTMCPGRGEALGRHGPGCRPPREPATPDLRMASARPGEREAGVPRRLNRPAGPRERRDAIRQPSYPRRPASIPEPCPESIPGASGFIAGPRILVHGSAHERDRRAVDAAGQARCAGGLGKSGRCSCSASRGLPLAPDERDPGARRTPSSALRRVASSSGKSGSIPTASRDKMPAGAPSVLPRAAGKWPRSRVGPNPGAPTGSGSPLWRGLPHAPDPGGADQQNRSSNGFRGVANGRRQMPHPVVTPGLSW
jgi:hypothetical protein